MRSSVRFRFVSVVLIVAALTVGLIAPAAAQDVTPEATSDFTSEMMTMEGACPQNTIFGLVDQLTTMQMEGGMQATEEAGGMEATAEAPGMEATEEGAGMEGTQEAAIGPECFVGSFSGAEEVPGPGDEDGYGLAFVTIDSMTGEVCYEVVVQNITLPAQAMHIHVGEEGVSGGVVVPFPTAPDENGRATGCTNAEDMAVLQDIVSNPEGYYVNVHTSDFPDGAVRAQLSDRETGRRMFEEDLGLDFTDVDWGDEASANG